MAFSRVCLLAFIGLVSTGVTFLLSSVPHLVSTALSSFLPSSLQVPKFCGGRQYESTKILLTKNRERELYTMHNNWPIVLACFVLCRKVSKFEGSLFSPSTSATTHRRNLISACTPTTTAWTRGGMEWYAGHTTTDGSILQPEMIRYYITSSIVLIDWLVGWLVG